MTSGDRKPKVPESTAAKPSKSALPILRCATAEAWAKWLATHHGASPGVWLKLGKRSSAVPHVRYEEALRVALAWGWIDGHKKAFDNDCWLQRFTPRGPRSLWSKLNRERAEELIAQGEMKPAGLAEVARAKSDGRWEAAYDSARNATVPSDLEKALAANRRAAIFWATLDGANRYAILYRLQTAKRPETRVQRIATFVEMLSKGETIHPRRSPRKPAKQ
jgi:uncharacterized protein YdeI (YjbR/CyaY-like superfamily)